MIFYMVFIKIFVLTIPKIPIIP